MANKKRKIGEEILQGLRELKGGDHGRVINVPNVATIRQKTGLSQARFAELLGVSVRTVRRLRLPRIRFGRSVRYSEKAVSKWLEARESES